MTEMLASEHQAKSGQKLVIAFSSTYHKIYLRLFNFLAWFPFTKSET